MSLGTIAAEFPTPVDRSAAGYEPRRVVAAACTRAVTQAVPVGAPPEHKHGDPQIELVREQGTIAAIRVRCGCGETFLIDCQYP